MDCSRPSRTTLKVLENSMKPTDITITGTMMIQAVCQDIDEKLPYRNPRMLWVWLSLVSISMVVTALKPMAVITPARTKLTLEFPLNLDTVKVSPKASTAKMNANTGVPRLVSESADEEKNTM